MSDISVIVPVYKVEKYLSRCLDSILRQTYTDFDLILVEDGSPDESGKICDEYAEKDNRIVVLHQKNSGAAIARNNGIDHSLKHSNSQWITFIDSDDWVSPYYLETLLKTIQESNCKVSICGYQKTEKEISLPKPSNHLGKIVKAEDYIFVNNIQTVVPWGKLYDKNLWKDIRFPEGRICEDEYVTYKALLKSNQLYIADDALYAYYVNPQSVMNERWSLKRLDAVDAHCERYEYFMENHPSLADRCLVQVWTDCRYQGQMALLTLDKNDQKTAFDYFNQVMKNYPLPWTLLFKQKPKEVIWLTLQKIQLKSVCKIRNRLSIGF